MWKKIVDQLHARQWTATDSLQVGSREVPLLMVRHPRARRYLLRLRSDGSARVTIPRGGNRSEARQFVERNRNWLDQQLQRWAERPAQRTEWRVGSEILFRGERLRIEPADAECIRLGDERLPVPDDSGDLRPIVEQHFRRLATRELSARVFEFAAVHGLTVQRVSVRNQRTRWGSCSRRGTISLNWRLIQTPVSVSDYIILHELAHLRHMNHSKRFWAEVEHLCPAYREAERWLKSNPELLR